MPFADSVPEPAAAPDPEAAGLRTVYLHVGLMKTGTTYLQSRLKEHRRELERDGVLVPSRQLTAMRDLFGMRGTLRRPDISGTWRQLITDLHTTEAPVAALSMEFLSTRPLDEVRDIVAEFAPADVHVVITLRDLARVLAAQWQETIQNRASWTWQAYTDDILERLAGHHGADPISTAAPVAELLDDDEYESHEDDAIEDDPVVEPDVVPVRQTATGRFWRQHDIAGIVQTWSAVVGADHVHIVTVPRPGASPDLLWERFSAIIGVDTAGYARRREAVRSNPGLDVASAEFLRRLNSRLEEDISRAAYLRHVKHLLGKRALSGRDPALKPALTPEQHEVVYRHSEELIEHLRGLGLRVVGDLGELLPAPPGPTIPLDDLRLEAQVADSAIDAVVAMIRHFEEAVQEAEQPVGTPVQQPSSGQRQRRGQARRRARRAARDEDRAPE